MIIVHKSYILSKDLCGDILNTWIFINWFSYFHVEVFKEFRMAIISGVM